jgi:protein-tyrosine kinase
VRTALKYAHGLSSRRLLVTSALASEGKTTLAANLAVAFAHLGEKVLLVDTDLRCPRLHEAFGLNNDVGVSQIFTETELPRLARQTSVPGLSLLTAGPLLASPSEFLCQPQFREKLAAVAAPFDRVILDSSPINQVTDAGILAYHADGVVLVVRDRHCTDAALELAVERLSAGPAKLLGVVINDLAPTLLNRRYAYYPRAS